MSRETAIKLEDLEYELEALQDDLEANQLEQDGLRDNERFLKQEIKKIENQIDELRD